MILAIKFAQMHSLGEESPSSPLQGVWVMTQNNFVKLIPFTLGCEISFEWMLSNANQ